MNKTSPYICEMRSPFIHAVIRRQFILPHSIKIPLFYALYTTHHFQGFFTDVWLSE